MGVCVHTIYEYIGDKLNKVYIYIVKLKIYLCFYSLKFICIKWSYLLIGFPPGKYCNSLKTNETLKASLGLLQQFLNLI